MTETQCKIWVMNLRIEISKSTSLQVFKFGKLSMASDMYQPSHTGHTHSTVCADPETRPSLCQNNTKGPVFTQKEAEWRLS